MSRHPRPLKFLGPQWFAVVMGWAGLGLAWHRAAPEFGEGAHAVALGCAVVAAAVFVVLAAGSLLRLSRHPEAVQEDLRHPVRHAFFAAMPIALILLATMSVALAGPGSAAEALWALGTALQFGVTVWVVARWPAKGLNWGGKTPVMFMPIVGNVLVPLAGVPLGHPHVSWFSFGIGMFFWPVVLALLFARTAQQPMPERLQPSWFISVAPPAVGGVALLALGQPVALAMAAFGVAVMFLAISLTLAPALRRMPFAMPFWAMSFPLAAVSALALRLAAEVPELRFAAIALLAFASLIVAWLSVSTLRGLRDGSLLAPEPVATIQPAPSNP